MHACQEAKLATFTTHGLFFSVPKILWHLVDKTPDMEGTKVIEAFRKTFDKWAPHMGPMTFDSTSIKGMAHIQINFAHDGDDDLPEPFGSDATLAYAFFPVNNKSSVWFDESENWGEMHAPNRINLFKVAVHEVGHCLGLDHSTRNGDIMEAIYEPNNIVNITSDSQDGLKFLYEEYWVTLGHEPEPDEPDTGDEGGTTPSPKKGIIAIIIAIVIAILAALGLR